MKKIILALFVLAFFASEADAFRWFGYNSRTINGTGRRVEIFKNPSDSCFPILFHINSCI